MIDSHDDTGYDELESMRDGTILASEHVGEPMDEDPTESTTRIYIQNLNGLCWNKEGGRWPYVCEAMETIQADIACFSELNTNTNDYAIRRKMEQVCQTHFKQNCLVMASSRHNTSTAFKPGGTAILARNSITARIKSHTRDRMGRWTSICLSTADSKKLRIISAYQVCHQTRPGSNTAAAHQTAQIIEESTQSLSIHRAHPRQAFIRDLQSFISHQQSEGEDIILAGDFNEEITSTDSGMNQLATACSLVDLFSLRLGTSDQPATYQRGSRRIDYILVTPTLLPHIKAAGYDPFGYRLPSDHRGMYLDLDNTAIFHEDLTPLEAAAKRDFNTKAPGVVLKYVTAKTKYLQEHRFFERLTTLETLTQPNNDLAETLDRDFQRASLHAARICTKKEKAPWSPKLAQAWAELHYYRLAKSAVTTTVNYQPAIQKIQAQWNHLPPQPPRDLEVIKQCSNQALQQLKQARQDAQRIRQEFLQSRLSECRANDDKRSAKILSRIIRAETQHKVYNKIKYLRNQETGSSSLSSLKIPKAIPMNDINAIKNLPDTPDYWETVTIPSEIEQILIQRNRQHFSQAEGTPFTTPPLSVQVGYKADGCAADLILEGQTTFPMLSDATSLLIQHLQKKTITTLDGTITDKEVLGKLQSWKETTSTSPSGLHLGHYHTTWRDAKVHSDEALKEKTKNNQKQLLRTTVSLLNYALRFGYTYDRWAKIVNVMLQKDQGNPRIHRLRIIHIYEADYNLLLAVKWRQALHHAETNKLLNNGLYGSRPGKSAHDPALIEVLQHEIYRMSMKPGVNFDLDATSCYDRILTSIAALCSRRMGVAEPVVRVNMATLENARYYLKTKMGISERWYTHSPDHPIHGTGQGSGNSPTIWCFVCSALFDAFESTAHGASFTAYDHSITLPMSIVGFVDDCAQRVNRFNDEEPPGTQQLIAIMERDAQLWNDLLWASGGALEQSKCSYHVIQTNWNTDGHPFLQGGTESTSIRLSHNGQITQTYQHSNYTAHKSLGCYINPAYTNTQQWQVTFKKNESFAQLLETNYFTRAEAWTLYTSTYLPSITYPMPITPMTKSQCDKLDARFLRALVPRCGFNQNMSRSIRHAPIEVGGAGFRTLYHEQGILLLQQIQKYLNSPQLPIGRLLRIALSWTQAFLGTSHFFLTDVHRPIPPAGPSLLLDLRTFLQDVDATIHLQDPPIPQTLRTHDRFIMDIALGLPQFSPKQLKQINSCRRFLQAQTLADITNLRGTTILPHMITGQVPPGFPAVRVAKFNQSKPGNQAWLTWKKYLRTISNRMGVLFQPLGDWTSSVQQVRHWPATVYCPTHDQLYSHHHKEQYKPHSRIAAGIFATLPDDVVVEATGYPTTTEITMGTLRPIRNYSITRAPHQVPIQIGISPPPIVQVWEQELLQHVEILEHPDRIGAAVTRGDLMLCSDGSVCNDHGTFGYVIATPNGVRLAKGRGEAPGAYPNSFRSEAYGVLATLRWLTHFTNAHPPTGQHKIRHYLDNKSVIHRIRQTLENNWEIPNHTLWPEQDVIEEIATTIQALPINIEFEWVKGHQDTHRPYAQLPLEAQLNCDADCEASRAQHNGLQQQNRVPPMPSTPSQVVLQNKTITSHLRHRIRQTVMIPRWARYIKIKFGWSDQVYQQIDWSSYRHIIRKYRDTWTTMVKHLHDICPTGHIAHRNNKHLPHECPTCSHPHEDNDHVLTCSHPTRLDWRTKTIQKATQYESSKTDPYLIDILQDGLTRYHRKLEPIQPDSYPDKYSSLIQQQNSIGWIELYRGRWSCEWKNLQDMFNSSQTSMQQPLPGANWILAIGRILIDQWLQLWKQRNADRHGEDNKKHSQLREQLLHAELQEIYTYQHQVCPSDKNLFYATAEDHIRHHPNHDTLENWIHTNKGAIIASVAQATRLGISRNRTLQEYPAFNPISQEGR